MSSTPTRVPGEDWLSVVGAVQSFLNHNHDIPQIKSLNNTQITSEESSSDISNKLTRIEGLLSNETSQETTDRVSINNLELSHILRTMQFTLPQGLRDLIIMAEEERIQREELQAELEAYKRKWKSELGRLYDLYSCTSAESGSNESWILRRKLAEANAEIEQLKHVIRSFQAKQLA